MDTFTPISALAGGVLIGAAASLLLWLNGRIAGISSIAGGLVTGRRGDIPWRLAFLAALVVGAALYYGLFGNTPVARPHFPGWLLAVGGCTSGHGVCGLARLSARSLVATLVFLVTGIATTFIVRHVFGVY